MNSTLTPVNTERTPETYNQDYLRNRKTMRRYQERNKERIAAYMCEYMKRYRLRPEVREKHGGLSSCRVYLRKQNVQSYKAVLQLGLTRAEFANKLGFGTEVEFCDYVNQRELDHIVSAKFIDDNHPELSPFLHRWYNVQFIEHKLNRVKGAYTDPTNPRVKEIILRMKIDLIKSQTNITRSEGFELAKLHKSLEQLIAAGNN